MKSWVRCILVAFWSFAVLGCSIDIDITDLTLASSTLNFEDPENFEFDSNYVEIKDNRVALKPLDLVDSGEDFTRGSHVGSSSNELLRLEKLSSISLLSFWAPRKDSIVGYWRFDGPLGPSANGSKIKSEIGPPGLVNGISAEFREGHTGSGIYFERSIGPTTLKIGEVEDYDFGNESFTVSYWLNIPEGTTNPRWSIGKGDPYEGTSTCSLTGGAAGTGGWGVAHWTTENPVNPGLYLSDGFECYQITSNQPIRRGVWSHIVVIVDRSSANATIYVNGVSRSASIASVGSISNTDHGELSKLSIGGVLSSETHSTIDEVAIWDRALLPNEVKVIFQRQSNQFLNELSPFWTPKWDSIVGYWKMDGNWQDSSGNGNHGTANGDATFTPMAKIGHNSGLFDGTGDYIDTASFQSTTGNLSFSAWFKANTLSVRNFIAFRINNDGLYPRLFINTDGSITFQYRVNPGVSHTFSTPPGIVSINNWYQVFATYSEVDGAKIYFNGQLVASKIDAGVLEIDGGNPTMLFGYDSNFIEYMDGSLDEIGLWHVLLNNQEISLIYNRQKQKYAGHYDSEVINLGATTSTWPDLSWSTSLPFGKELVGDFNSDGNPDNESSSDYNKISGDFGKDLLAYWRFDERPAVGTPSGADFEDSSGLNSHGVNLTNITIGKSGKLGRSIFLDGFDDGITITGTIDTTVSTESDFSMSMWVRPSIIQTNTQGTTNYVWEKNGSSVGAHYPISLRYYNQSHTNHGKFRCAAYDGVQNPVAISDSPDVGGIWTHVTCVRSDSKIKIYINGQLEKEVSDTTTNIGGVNNGKFYIGSRHTGDYNFQGNIDEVMAWKRGVSDLEVQQLYRRGANRIKIQVKSCVDTSCNCKSFSASPVGSMNDCDGDGIVNAEDGDDIHQAEFMGPGGDGTTYFSELMNRRPEDVTFDCDANTSDSNDNICVDDEILLTGSPRPTSPMFSFDDYLGIAKPEPNRYFQYRVHMEADENTACEGEPCLPELASVSLLKEGESRYYGATQVIESKHPILYDEILSVGLDSGPCVEFQLSPDRETYYFWNGKQWAQAAGETRSTAAEVSENIVKYSDQFRNAGLYFKVFLSSDTTEPCSLGKIDLNYRRQF